MINKKAITDVDDWIKVIFNNKSQICIGQRDDAGTGVVSMKTYEDD